MDWLWEPTVPNDTVDTSWLRDITVGQVLGAVLLLCLLIYTTRKIVKAWRPINRFLGDWSGEPPRDGVPGRPGVMARFTSQDERLDRIESHLSDAVTRREFEDAKGTHERDTRELKEHLARHDVQLAGLGVIQPGPHHTVTTVVSSVEPIEHKETP